MTARWTFTFTCSTCGGATSPVATGSPSVWHTTAIVLCEGCGSRWQLTVLAEQLSAPAAPKPPLPCGTDRAYRRHYERGEKPCDLCRAAHAEARRGERARD